MATEKTTMPAGIPDLTKKEVQDAKKDGAKDYIKEGVAAQMASDTGTTGDPDNDTEIARLKVNPAMNTTPFAPLLDLSADELENRLKDKPKDNAPHIDFEAAKVLLALERAGQNRTNYVMVLLKAIGTDDPYKVTPAGPPYTNDQTNVTEFK